MGIRRKGLLLLGIFVFLSFSLPVSAADEWSNNTWHYRMRMEINATSYNRTNWTVERDLNFTYLLNQLNGTGSAFDNNSVRVFEYNASGGLVREVPSQFDLLPGYDNTSNAIGTLLFQMNGTTYQNTSRIYYVYFDESFYGAKPVPSYPSAINYSTSEDEFYINNSMLEIGVDTNRNQNTSGIFRIIGREPPFNTMFDVPASGMTAEYSQFSDGTNNLTFNFSGNISVVQGPVRTAVTLVGDEIYWNDPENYTYAGHMVKTYYFYATSGWIKVHLNYTNLNDTAVNRSSTDSGALGFDISAAAPRGFSSTYSSFGNPVDPNSWSMAYPPGSFMEVGLVHLNESGTTNFSIRNDSTYGRIGVHFNYSTVAPNESIADTALIKVNTSEARLAAFQDFRNSWADRESYNESLERWNVTLETNTTFNFYNRNETVVINATILSDIYNLASMVNVSIDNGTPGVPGDDFSVILYDDGTHGDAVSGDLVFTHNFTLNDSANITSNWTLNASAWDASNLFLGFDVYSFNVTEIYNVTMTVLTPLVLANNPVNASLHVQNYRLDTVITGASVSCNYTVQNTFDFNNGTYMVTFTAPSTPNTDYLVMCNATRNGNYGEDADSFAVDADKTNMSISVEPGVYNASSITQADNESYVLLVYSNNTGNGTAVQANLSLALPSGWSANSTLFSCGNVSVGGNCSAAFLVTIPNATGPGNYSINVSALWGNPDATSSSNLTAANVSVLSNPVMNLSVFFLFDYVAPNAEKIFGYFNISSLGNDDLSNVTFNVSNLDDFTITFAPPSFTNISGGTNQAVQINVTAPLGQPTGNYTGTLNVSANNSGYINLTLVIAVSGTNLTISINPNNHTTTNITQTNNNTFVLEVNSTNPGNMTAFDANISLSLPANFTSNSSLYSCGNLNVSDNCSAQFFLTVLAGTPPGNVSVNASLTWNNPEAGNTSNQTPLDVTVASNPVLTVSPANLSANATHGNTTTIANFTLNSTGNDEVQNITYALSNYPNFSVTLINNVSNLTAGTNVTISINVSVPLFHDPGATSGSLYMNSTNAPPHNMSLEINVSEDRSWSMTPTECEKTESPDFGTVCEVFINNTGNTYINFTLDPQSANFSELNITTLNLTKFGNYLFLASYNVTGEPKINYTAIYTINVTDVSGSPLNRSLTIRLIPFASLSVNISVISNRTEQLGSVTVYGNVTDANLVGIVNMTMNITDPTGNTSTNNMTLINVSNNTYQFTSTFPNVSGNTIHRGNYTVVITATDTILVQGNQTNYFFVYTHIVVSVQTLSNNYYPGDTASVFYQVQEAANSTLYPVNATVSVTNPNNITFFNQTYAVGTSGLIEPLPTFVIGNDQPLGNYTLSAYSIYDDTNVSLVVNDTQNYTFEVIESAPSNVTFSGLLAEIDAGDLWYIGDTVETVVSVFDVNGTPLDPDSMNLTVFAPNDTIISNASLANFTKYGTGLYRFAPFTVSTETESGVYIVLLNVSKGNFSTSRLTYFRIASSLTADIETQVIWYPNSVMQFDVVVHALEGLPLDPDSMNITVYDPAEAIYFQANLTNFTRVGEGFYILEYAMPINTATGDYLAFLNVSKGNMHTNAIHPFRVSSGGPYDVRLEMLENEVEQGDYLDFRIVVENMGDVSQDVFLEYWTEDASEQTWYFASEAVFVASGQQQSFLRSAFIYTSQPAGSYFMKVRMSYSVIQPPIFANETFLVTGADVPTTTPTPPSGGGPPTSISVTPTPPPGDISGSPSATPLVDLSQLTIVSVPDEVVVESGDTKYLKIEARNDGLTVLHNLTLLFSGLPLSWTEIRPSQVNALAQNDIASFVVKVVIPKSEKTGIKSVRALVVADEAQDEKQFNLVVFESRVSLVEYELQRLEERLRKLAKNTKEAEDVGKEVNAVWALIEDATAYKNLAQEQLRREQLDDALTNTKLATVSLAKATALLAASGYRPPPFAGIPVIVLVVSVFSAIGLAFLIFLLAKKRGWLNKKLSLNEVIKPSSPAQVPPPTDYRDVEGLEKEKEKILRVLNLLEEELHQGVISQTAYRELKKRNERKLQGLEKQLKKARY
ncbi:hypothetical protein KJ765_00730 [Candidatus Micrarchaeota archaeon]|nr:hypothetical protein [Candidatus Micrarchaeota archaeon]